MKTYGISTKTFELLLETFNQYEEIEKVFLFGSRAVGTQRNGSDIDIAIKGENINSDLIYNLKITFNGRLPIPYKVDVVSYDSLNHEKLNKEISRKSKLIYSRDKSIETETVQS